MNVALFCALKTEWGEIRKKCRFVPAAGRTTLPCYESQAHEGVRLYQTGIGFKRAGEFFKTFSKETKPTLVVQFGFAGALRPHLKPGDMILTTSCTLAQNETVFPDGNCVAKGEKILETLGYHFEKGGLLTSPVVLENKTQKREAGEKSGALACDMETFFLARFCSQNAIPFLSVRTIFDPLDWDLSDLSNLGFGSVFNPRFLFNVPRYHRAAALGNKRLARFLLALINGSY